MSFKLFVILLYFDLIEANWVKLPDILPTSRVPNVVFKLAPPPKSAVLSSEMVSSIFSMPSTTTEQPFLNDNISTRKSYIRHYFQTTVTPKAVVSILTNLSAGNEDILEPVYLQSPEKNKKNRTIFFNKTVQMNVIPIKNHQVISTSQSQNVNYNNDDDDGVTIADDDPEAEYYDDEYYYEYDIDQTTKFNSLKYTSTTEMPPKTHKKKSFPQKLQRRTMIQIMKDKQYKPFGEISFPSFIRFIKKVQESFAIRTAKTIGEKIRMLAHFRDQLMLSINKQIRRLWKVQPAMKKKKSSSSKRVKRTLGLDHSHGSGAMDFPSAEGALLSICFLTFAVFLIKLVLQVIQTIKMKKAMWATQMMMGTENVVIKRQQRSTPSDEELYNLTKIYESMEKLRLKY